jgi:hypothetical protein
LPPPKGDGFERSNRSDNINQLSKAQLDDIINYLLQEQILVPYENQVYPKDVTTVHRCTKAFGTKGDTNPFRKGYPQFAVLQKLEKKWSERKEPYVPHAGKRKGGPDGKDQHATKFSIHLIYWRWQNEGKPIPDGMEISHLWGGYKAIMYLTCETPTENDSRQYCFHLQWYRKGICPHNKPKCWGDGMDYHQNTAMGKEHICLWPASASVPTITSLQEIDLSDDEFDVEFDQ